ncbi:hypothetical protein C5Y97_24440 [Blastopirellula marina]|uniref:Uncharacterized protein n=2 Tax=Blastopirellula marina TaxID=124 RepID=A0A2S8F9T5_9BACT|nr:hypothetical protein C5Y98_24425 [Blastopirellula marina]PTL42182.1 hypothetical protein C5Y97_24440 [Blastopirellula marina]
MDSANRSEDTLSQILAERIGDVMKTWDEPESVHREQLEEARREFQPRADEIAREAAATERLDANDFAFRINATR